MDSRYNYTQTEDKIYALWEKADAFNPDTVKKLRKTNSKQEIIGSSDATTSAKKDSSTQISSTTTNKPFSIIMPPPNANDPLHVGHAMFVAIEDIMIRYHRMLGDDTVWIPGTDHAGIETQFVFEKKLKKKGQSRFNFDRSTLFQMIWDDVQENSDIAIDQIKKLGASADWSRFKFTLDKDIVKDVLKTFNSLHEDQLIYRDLKLVNYCTRCGTSYSELEVNHKERIDPLYTIQYGPLQVSTVRLETIFGDVAVAVNPNDPRYKKYVGTNIEVEFPWGKKTMPVIADKYVNPEFGTGAVKVTPYHDPNDFQMWTNHKDEILEIPQPIINTLGKLYNKNRVVNLNQDNSIQDSPSQNNSDKKNTKLTNLVPEKYDGLGIVNARKAAVEDYENYKTAEGKSLLISVDKKYSHSVGTCYKCARLIEPLPIPQFFIKVNGSQGDNNSKTSSKEKSSKMSSPNLVKDALRALNSGETKIHGAGREKILRNWLENLRDWNISRQIVWGISIPVWYHVNGNEDKITVGFLDKDKKYQTGLLSEWLKKYSLAEIKKNIQTMTAEISVPYSVSVEDPNIGMGVVNGDIKGLNITQKNNQNKKAINSNYIQETDTFDTWFSSSQWPVVTLQNTSGKIVENKPSQIETSIETLQSSTAKTSDFDRFYPTSVMETGYDILPIWVMRMMLLGIYQTGKSPFKDVYLHGLVRDDKGKKMSKSKGNVINPIEVKKEFGADALRMALVIRSTPGQDKSVGAPDFKATRNLTNKIWNAARFTIMMSENPSESSLVKNAPGDKEYKQKLNSIIDEVTKHLNDLKIGLAAETCYNEFWHWYCDISIEDAKKGNVSLELLNEGLIIFLKLFHPFMPFVTEAIWQELVKLNVVTDKLLIVSDWPTQVS